jgi:hypothetical protein
MKVCSPLEDDVQRIKKQRSYRVFNFFVYPATGALFSFAVPSSPSFSAILPHSPFPH